VEQATDGNDTCTLHAGYLRLYTHTQSMYYLLLFNINNGCTLPILLIYAHFFQEYNYGVKQRFCVHLFTILTEFTNQILESRHNQYIVLLVAIQLWSKTGAWCKLICYKDWVQKQILTFWHWSFTFNSNESPTWCNIFSVYYPDVCLQLNMFRTFSRPSSGAQKTAVAASGSTFVSW
jgi:hypothetical protein